MRAPPFRLAIIGICSLALAGCSTTTKKFEPATDAEMAGPPSPEPNTFHWARSEEGTTLHVPDWAAKGFFIVGGTALLGLIANSIIHRGQNRSSTTCPDGTTIVFTGPGTPQCSTPP
jgi:hypothetical protein